MIPERPSASPDVLSQELDRHAPEALQQLSHDIRSAMSDVLGGIRLVDTARLDPQALTQIDRVRAAADTLAALVDDALLTAAGETMIRQGQAQLTVETWITALDRRWRGRAAERGSLFGIVRHGALPERLNVSQVALDRIVGNLVGNALIHVAESTVRVELSCLPEQGFEIRVMDDGPGFPDRVLNGQDGAKASANGSGLGLHIVQQLSANLPASLDLSNLSPSGHACARLMIPSDHVVWHAPVEPASPPPDLRGLHILVAEDNLTNQTILRQMLDTMGAQTVFVTDGRAAADALERDRFDIALLDIEMPRMSGLEVMEQVRASGGAAAKIPLVAITAYVLRDNREAIYAAGADGIIGKPIASLGEFGRSILRHVGRAATPQDDSDVLVGMGFGPAMDATRLDRLLDAAGPQGAPELLDRVIEDLTAVEATLERAHGDGDLAEIRAQTHILIAISGAVGADRLCQLSEVLNIAAKRKKKEQLAQVYALLHADLEELLAVIAKRRAGLG